MSTKAAFKKTFNKREPIISLTLDQVLEAYEKYGDDAFKIDLENSNDYDSVSYIPFLIKLANDDTKYIKFNLKVVNIKTCNGLRDPEERDYPNIQIKFRARDEDKESKDFTKFGEVMNIINMFYTKKIRQYKEQKVIVCKKDEDAYEEALAANPKCKGMFSVNASTFYQASYKDATTKKNVKMDNPLINCSLDEDVFEKDSGGNKVIRKPWKNLDKKYKKVVKPILVYPFNVKIYDYKKTVIKNGRLQGTEATVADSDDEEKQVKITNVNVQKFITPRSLITGDLGFQITDSQTCLKLKCSFKKNMYVIRNKRAKSESNELSQELFNQMGENIGSDYDDSDDEDVKPSAKNVTVSTADDDDEDDDI